MNKLRAVFFGTPDFSVPTLNSLFNHPNIELVSVVSMPDRPSGRGHKLKSPEVIEFCKENNISYFQTSNINKEEKYLEEIENEKVDIFIVLAFAQFLNDRLLNIPRIACFNIHTSILPKYRGAAPIQYALLNGDQMTGVSIQKMVKKMDAGDLVAQTPIPISNEETGGTLYTKLMNQAPLTLNNLLEDIKNNSLTFTKQDEGMVTFAPTLKKVDGLLNFKESTYQTLINQVKALDPWPGTWCMLNGKRLKVFKIEKSSPEVKPGKAIINNNQIIVGCLDGSLRIRDIQLEGKKRTTDTDYLNGHKGDLNINEE